MNLKPVGIMPEHIWKGKRIWDLKEAIKRSLDAGEPVPQEWMTEHNKLLKELRDVTKEDI